MQKFKDHVINTATASDPTANMPSYKVIPASGLHPHHRIMNLSKKEKESTEIMAAASLNVVKDNIK